MLELTVKEKERIGKLFKYYRKKNKIHWKEIEKICSPATYSKLEKGKKLLSLAEHIQVNYLIGD